MKIKLYDISTLKNFPSMFFFSPVPHEVKLKRYGKKKKKNQIITSFLPSFLS